MTDKDPFKPRHFQTLVENHILAGQDIILQAPTGAGKTEASWQPALKGFEKSVSDYPQRMIHAVPMRVLARSFMDKFTDIAQKNPKWQREKWYPSIQIGEQATDALFENRLIIATVDQVLASFLNIPYGISKRLDNINAGAFIGSYLIFDEFHLYPTKEMLLTVLAMLKMLKGVSRFVLMSATFSPALLTAIASELGAKSIYDAPDTPLSEGIFSDIEALKEQKRRWQVRDSNLDNRAIEQALQEHRTVLVICNQVDRAQEVYRTFKSQDSDTDCTLLHSRFYADDRRQIEDKILLWLGENVSDGRKKVIIATQVVEVGLDISADILLTECAPAASLIQRAGRCARWGGDGDIWVYQPPLNDKTGSVNYAPYIEDGLETVCHLTWDALSSSDFDDKILPYNMEQKLVKVAHEAHDQEQLIDGLSSKLDERIGRITECMNTRDEGLVSELIRNQDNNSARVYIMGDSQNDIITKKIDRLEALNISKGLLKRAYEHADDNETDADFFFKAGEAVTEEYEEAEQVRTRTVYNWEHPLKEANKVYQHRLILAHPAVLGYTKDIGVYINTGSILAPDSPERSKGGSRQSYSYNADTYVQHIEGLHLAYKSHYDFLDAGQTIFYRPLYHEIQYGILNLLKRMKRSETLDDVDRYLRLMLALHDVGKLNKDWQAWAQARHALYTEKIIANDKVPSDGTPLAHTVRGKGGFVTENEEKAFELAFKQIHLKTRGNHSVESAEAVSDLVWQVTEGDWLWYSVIIAAICHHHTPTAHEAGSFKMVSEGKNAIIEALEICKFTHEEATAWSDLVQTNFTRHNRKLGGALSKARPAYSGYDVALIYFLFVRILRLSDQRSSAYIHKGGYGTT